MTLKKFQEYFTKELHSLYPKEEIQSFFSIVIEEYLGLKRIDLVMQPDFEIPFEKIQFLRGAILRLQNSEPIQYIVGKTEFFGLPFYVNKNVLIPRPETEELVEWIIQVSQEKREKRKEIFRILDIGTGSGCIPIALKKHLDSTDITAIDISNKAIETTSRNAELNGVDIRLIQQDILRVDSLNSVIASKAKQSSTNDETISSRVLRNDNKFDIIVSNPPYVRDLEKAEIQDNVLEHEPHLALFVDDNNPLIFYKKIAALAKNHLTENGSLFFEINEYLGEETIKVIQEEGFKNYELKKDIFGKDRMIKASFF